MPFPPTAQLPHPDRSAQLPHNYRTGPRPGGNRVQDRNGIYSRRIRAFSAIHRAEGLRHRCSPGRVRVDTIFASRADPISAFGFVVATSFLACVRVRAHTRIQRSRKHHETCSAHHNRAEQSLKRQTHVWGLLFVSNMVSKTADGEGVNLDELEPPVYACPHPGCDAPIVDSGTEPRPDNPRVSIDWVKCSDGHGTAEPPLPKNLTQLR